MVNASEDSTMDQKYGKNIASVPNIYKIFFLSLFSKQYSVTIYIELELYSGDDLRYMGGCAAFCANAKLLYITIRDLRICPWNLYSLGLTRDDCIETNRTRPNPCKEIVEEQNNYN